MNTLYLDCGMGAAGDMLAAALYELLDDQATFLAKMNAAGIPGVTFSAERTSKCGIMGTHFRVLVDGVEEGDMHEHHDRDHHEHDHHDHDHHDHDHHDHEHDHHEHHHVHRSMADIEGIFASLAVSEKVRQDALDVYRLIAEAEGHAHGKPVSEIHFHEVGTMDAIADVTAVCQLMELLHVDQVLASPVHVGCGSVHCAHGILPVPAPATAYILRDVPIYGGRIQGELCTPTGAALLKKFVSSFGEMPPLKIKKIGYGMGTKDFEAANCVRALLAENAEEGDAVLELNCNLDDMTPEHIGFAMERLFEAGALDVYTIPIGMKKSRPGVMLCVICRESDKEQMVRQIFRHTTTLGIRENHTRRYTLQRRIDSLQTPLGEVHVKVAEGYGASRRKIEYEELARIARQKGISLDEAERML